MQTMLSVFCELVLSGCVWLQGVWVEKLKNRKLFTILHCLVVMEKDFP